MTRKSASTSTSSAPRQFFDQHGYWIEPGVLTHAQCDALIGAGESLPAFKQGDTRPAMMPHRENTLILQSMKNPNIVTIMEQLLDGKIDGLQTEFFYCKPGTKGFSLHQDNFFVEAPYGAFGSVWIALTDTYAEKGGLIVYPGSHQAGLLPVRELRTERDAGQDPNANNEEAVVPPQYKQENPRVPKGAALFIHGLLVHGSNRNASQEWRQVLLCTYIRQNEPFRAGRYARREVVPVYN